MSVPTPAFARRHQMKAIAAVVILVLSLTLTACANRPSKTDNWNRLESEQFNCQYPEGWFLTTADNFMQLTSTGKQIVLGGAAPDDYYLDGGQVNEVKYSSNFVVITVRIANLTRDWQDFLTENYEGTVKNVSAYDLAQNYSAVGANELSGFDMATKRIFVRGDKHIFDIALIDRSQTDNAEEIFAEFLRKFDFGK